MSDIIERSLALQVTGEDLASDVFASIGDEIEALEQRFQTSFDGMASYAQDTSSTIADAAQEWAPAWISQLEALEGAAAGAFSAIAETAATQALAMAGSWNDAFAKVVTDSAKAAETVDTIWSADDGVAATDADKFATTWTDGFDKVVTDATKAAGKVDEAWSGDDGDAVADADKFAASWSDGFDKVVTDASTAAGKVDEAWRSDDTTAATEADKFAASWNDGFDKVVTDASEATKKVDEAWSSDDAAAVTEADKFAASWAEGFDKVVADASGAADKVDTAWAGDDSAAKVAADKFALSWDDAFGGVVASAKGAASEVGASFAESGATAGEAGAAGATAAGTAGAVGTATEDVAGVTLGSKVAGLGEKIPNVSMAAVMGGAMTGAIGLGASDLAINQLEGLEALKAQTGSTWQQTLELAATSKGAGVSSDQLQTYIQRLDKNIGELDQKAVLGATVEGEPVPLGFGKEGVNPKSLAAIGAGGSNAAALALKSIDVTPDMLNALSNNGSAQLALIAERIDALPSALMRNTVTSELLGRGAGADFLMTKYSEANTEAIKNLPKGLAGDLQTTLGAGGSKSMVDFQQEIFYLEVEMSASLIKMVPGIDGILSEVIKHTKLLEDLALGAFGVAGLKKGLETGGGALSEVEKLAKEILGPVAGYAGKAAKDLLKGGGTTADELRTGGGDIAGGAIGGSLLEAGGKLLGPLGITAGFLADPGNLANDTSKQALLYQKLATVKTMSATQASGLEEILGKAYGLPAGLVQGIAKQEAGVDSHGNPLTSPSGATGLMQLMPATAASMFKQYTGQSISPSTAEHLVQGSQGLNALLGSEYLSDLYHQSGGSVAKTAAGYNAGGGAIGAYPSSLNWKSAGTSTGTVAGYVSSVEKFTQEFAKADTETAKHATSVAKETEKGLSDSANSAKKHGPEIPKPIAAAYVTLVNDTKAKGVEFTSENQKMIEAVLDLMESKKPAMNQTGRELVDGLLQGLRAEEPALKGEAQSLANQLEATLKDALKVKSPSEMTAEIGENLMAGLSLGIHRSTSGATAVAARAAVGVAGALGGSGGGAGAGAGQVVHVEIPVTIDGKEVGRASSQFLLDQAKLVSRFN